LEKAVDRFKLHIDLLRRGAIPPVCPYQTFRSRIHRGKALTPFCISCFQNPETVLPSPECRCIVAYFLRLLLLGTRAARFYWIWVYPPAPHGNAIPAPSVLDFTIKFVNLPLAFTEILRTPTHLAPSASRCLLAWSCEVESATPPPLVLHLGRKVKFCVLDSHCYPGRAVTFPTTLHACFLAIILRCTRDPISWPPLLKICFASRLATARPAPPLSV